jgi:hypothetical protein
MKITHLLKAILVVCIGFTSLLAQDSLSVIGKFIQGHPWTMDFGISSNLTLSNFQGAAISISKFISDYQKYRFGISTSINSGSSDQSGINFSADTLVGQSKQNIKTDRYFLELSFQYITYATPHAYTSFYFGIGPLAGIGWSKYNGSSNSNYVGSSQSQYNSNNTYTSYSLGVLGSLGVEWFFSEHISLHAEYGLEASYTWNKNESTYNSQYNYSGSNSSSTSKSSNSSSSSNWSLAGQQVIFGISVNY